MKTILWLRKNVSPRFCRWRAMAFGLGLLLLPWIAFAQDAHDHEHDVPLDPQAQAFQVRVYAFVGLGIVLFLVWYGLRWWQIRHGPGISGSGDNLD